MTFGQKGEESAPRSQTPVPPNQGDSVAGSAANPSDSAPLLRVISPSTTAEEVAALVAVFASLGGAGEAPAKRPRSEWSAHHRKLRRTLAHGPGGWRSSGLPR